METETKINGVRRIAVVAPEGKRKELIEWSYFNKDVLANHELIATNSTARVLEGTVNKPVYRLSDSRAGGYRQLAALMQDNKVDMIFFFENPLKTVRPNDTKRKLLDIALDMNILIGGDRSTLDFMRA